MSDHIDISDLRRMFTRAAQQIREQQYELSRLDSVGGDGDHGVTMTRAMEVLEVELRAEKDRTLSVRLKDAGWCLLGIGGGASSALLGTFISGMGEVNLGAQIDCVGLSQSFVSGLRAVERQTKAQPGDKTLMDALMPAVQAFQSAAAEGKSLAQSMEVAAHAAKSGAESTAQMIARYGRAKFLGERTLGSPDAGATSIALMFHGFNLSFAECKENAHG